MLRAAVGNWGLSEQRGVRLALVWGVGCRQEVEKPGLLLLGQEVRAGLCWGVPVVDHGWSLCVIDQKSLNRVI